MCGRKVETITESITKSITSSVSGLVHHLCDIAAGDIALRALMGVSSMCLSYRMRYCFTPAGTKWSFDLQVFLSDFFYLNIPMDLQCRFK